MEPLVGLASQMPAAAIGQLRSSLMPPGLLPANRNLEYYGNEIFSFQLPGNCASTTIFNVYDKASNSGWGQHAFPAPWCTYDNCGNGNERLLPGLEDLQG